jgi:zinc transporter ZupT
MNRTFSGVTCVPRAKPIRRMTPAKNGIAVRASSAVGNCQSALAQVVTVMMDAFFLGVCVMEVLDQIMCKRRCKPNERNQQLLASRDWS